MKNTLLLLSAVLLSLSSIAQFGWNNRISGSGKIIKQTRKVGEFHSVSNAGSWDVMISEGDGNGTIEVEGDDNLLSYIETKVEDGRLYVGTTRNTNIRSSKRITIYISMSKIRELSVSGSGDIIGKGRFDSDGTVRARVSGSGGIRLDFGRFSTLEPSVSGSGSIVMKGTAENVDASVSGSGGINCYEVVSDHARGRVSGSGNIRVNATISVNCSIAGSGNMYYRGGALNVQTRKSGSGRIVKG
jgi:hypothetical protein